MPKNEPSCVKFKSWIIQDVFDVLWLNRSVVAAAVSWLALFAVFDAIVPHPALLGPDGVLSLGGTCWFVARALVDAVALIVVGISAQLSCLTRQGGWGAILAANRKAVLCCSVGMWGLAVLTIAMVLVYQQFFVADIIRALLGSSREPSHSGRLLIRAFILVGFLGVIALGANWFPAVLAGADRSMRKTWQRGSGAAGQGDLPVCDLAVGCGFAFLTGYLDPDRAGDRTNGGDFSCARDSCRYGSSGCSGTCCWCDCLFCLDASFSDFCPCLCHLVEIAPKSDVCLRTN